MKTAGSICNRAAEYSDFMTKLLFHYKNDEKAENSVLIKIVLIYRGSAYGAIVERIVEKCIQSELIEESQCDWMAYSLQRKFMNFGGFFILVCFEYLLRRYRK